MINKSGSSRNLKGISLFMACFMSFVGLSASAFSGNANETEAVARFSWDAGRKLSWSDFQGPVNTVSEESAAATCCSIGFRLNKNAAGTPELSVYNTFYINKSWVKADAKIESILAHEQGHFDLCELYTRQLRSRLAVVDLHSPTAKQQLMAIYSAVNNEYEVRQQAYEQETQHGTILPEQHRWENQIAGELASYEVEVASL